MKLGLVLVGGGACGEFQAGALYSLWHAGIIDRAEIIVGTSVGGLNACILAKGLLMGHGAEELKTQWAKITKNSDVFTPDISGAWWRNAFTYLGIAKDFFTGPAAFDNAPLRKRVNEALGESYTDDLKGKQIAVRAYHYGSGCVHTLQGRLQDMALCTSAIEGVFPAHLGYGDGGAGDNAPIDTAIELGATHVLIIYCGPEGVFDGVKIRRVEKSTPNPPQTTGLKNVLTVAQHITQANEDLVWNAAQAHDGVDFIHVFPNEDTGNFLDFKKRGLWELGEEYGMQAVLQMQSMGWL
jgi:predicted acylesterase/phospholipase RssA